MLFGQKHTICVTHRSLKHFKSVDIFIDMTSILNDIDLHITLNTVKLCQF